MVQSHLKCINWGKVGIIAPHIGVLNGVGKGSINDSNES
jgi:hypothetical protein